MFVGAPGVPEGVVDSATKSFFTRLSEWVVSLAVVFVPDTVAVTVPLAVFTREIKALDFAAPGEPSKSIYIFFRTQEAGTIARAGPSVEMLVARPIEFW